ncbi:phenoloxidase-activating factor 2-like [Cherax quadricarinatus]|uniref:phenoloxidase-activating factor 2-like n=1 Tax=Cherax quadricarinatus TaxID=27406 RepID=UPI00387E88A2
MENIKVVVILGSVLVLCCCERLPPQPVPQHGAVACPRELVCVPRDVCHAEGLRAFDPYTCGRDRYRGYICCLPRDIEPGQLHEARRRPGPQYLDFYDEEYGRLFGSLSKHAKFVLKNYRHKEECGVRNEAPQLTRISSGFINDKVITNFGEFPWHVALLVKERHFSTGSDKPREILRYICGSTLITPGMLVTAAHCVKGIKIHRLKAHLGDWNLHSSAGELFPAVERYISSVIIHSGYNPATYVNDVALLQLDRPVDTYRTPHISPICLPEEDYRFENHMKCYIVGWGDDVYQPNFGSNVLKAAVVTYTSDEECEKLLYKSLHKVDDNYALDKRTQKCIIGGYGRDACVGDGGGGVVCPLDNKAGPQACHEPHCANDHYFMSGIISFGSPVCGEGSVTIITDIMQYINWIYTIITPVEGLRGYKGRSTASTKDSELVNATDFS